MNDQLLHKPRKKRAKQTLFSPFPIPIQTLIGSEANNSKWYYYFAHMESTHVAVYRKGDLMYLYSWGFFGKGILSSSQPQFNDYQDVSCKIRAKEALNLDVKNFSIRQERLRQHKEWRLRQNLKEEYITSTTLEESLQQPRIFDLFEREELLTDGEDSDEESLKRKRPDQNIAEGRQKLLKLEDDYKLFEFLQLTFEEAFFLSYGLGCLAVENENGNEMSIDEMWNFYRARKKDFVHMYVAYHHFRSKGWVVRFSNLFGADFVLYQDGMPFYHASYSVFVTCADKENARFSWRDLSCICRVNEKIAKEVLVCYIIKPKDFNDEELDSVKCLGRFQIMETVVRRWLPEKYRVSMTTALN